jgi:hypothetical protein
MGKYADTKSQSEIEVSPEDYYKSIDPFLQQLSFVDFQLQLLKGTLKVIDKNIEDLMESDDHKSLAILTGLVARQAKELKKSAEELAVN